MRASAWIGVIGLAATLVVASPPPVPETPAAVETLIYARPFRLDEGYAFEWRKERPKITRA